jgi:hypothetical protein
MERLRAVSLDRLAIKTRSVMQELDLITGSLKAQYSDLLPPLLKAMQKNTLVSAARIGTRQIHAKCSGVEMGVNVPMDNLALLTRIAT